MSKRMTLGLMAVLIPLAWSWPVMADTEAPNEELAESEPQIDRYICTSERQTGSRIRRRVCRTESQIAEDREEGREFIEDTIGWSSQRPRAN